MSGRYRSGNLGIILLLLISGCLVRCSTGREEVDGVETEIVEEGNGRKVKHGEYLLLDMDVLVSDSMLHREDQGLLYQIRYDTYMNRLTPPNPLERAIHNLSKGDSAVLTADLAAMPDQWRTMTDEPGKVTAYVRVVDIVDYKGYTAWRMEQAQLRRTLEENKMTEMLRKESVVIDSALNASHREFKITTSGIRYFMLKEGVGDVPQEGDTVFFEFHAVLLDGKELPNGVGFSGAEPRSFVMGSEKVFPCWRESVSMLMKGGSGKFYFPSAMAFGSSEVVGIPPNSILVTEIKLVDVRRVKN